MLNMFTTHTSAATVTSSATMSSVTLTLTMTLVVVRLGPMLSIGLLDIVKVPYTPAKHYLCRAINNNIAIILTTASVLTSEARLCGGCSSYVAVDECLRLSGEVASVAGECARVTTTHRHVV